jgi:hypothetical protein
LSSPAGDRRRSRLANVRWSEGLDHTLKTAAEGNAVAPMRKALPRPQWAWLGGWLSIRRWLSLLVVKRNVGHRASLEAQPKYPQTAPDATKCDGASTKRRARCAPCVHAIRAAVAFER